MNQQKETDIVIVLDHNLDFLKSEKHAHTQMFTEII